MRAAAARLRPLQRVEREARRLTGRVLCDVREPVVERCRPVVAVEPRREVHEAGERGQAAEPAAATAPHAVVEPGAEGLHARRVGVRQGDRRLGQHERDIPLERIVQALALVCDRVGGRCKVDENVVAAEQHRKAAQVVRELVERASRAQVEPRVVPVARQDPVRDRPAMEREAHMRAAVVDRVHRVAVGEQAHGVRADADDQPAGFPELGQRGSTDERLVGDHGHRGEA